jgi:hypothetical protein
VSAPGKRNGTSRRTLLMAGLVVLGLNAVVFLVWTLPQLVRERNVTTRIEALRAQVGRERDMATALEQWSETMTKNARDSQRFYLEVVGSRGQNLVPVLKEIEKVARDLGVAAGDVTNAPSTLKDLPLVRFDIKMPIKGPYRQLVSFLDRMERSRHFLIVDQVALREKEAGGPDLEIEMSTYFRAEPGGSRGN